MVPKPALVKDPFWMIEETVRSLTAVVLSPTVKVCVEPFRSRVVTEMVAPRGVPAFEYVTAVAPPLSVRVLLPLELVTVAPLVAVPPPKVNPAPPMV